MGHQVEYLIGVSSRQARDWLSKLDGWFDDEPETSLILPSGEFTRDGIGLVASMASDACKLAIPEIKYSGLIQSDPSSIERIARLEEWLLTSLPAVPILRVDELLRGNWERDSGQEWYEWTNPMGAVSDWLQQTGQDRRYYRFLDMNSQTELNPN